RLLETTREYGLEHLTKRAEADAVRLTHTDYYLGLAEQADQHMRGPNQKTWLNVLRADQDNLRAALDWSYAQHDVERAVRLSKALWGFWNVRGDWSEARTWYERMLGLTTLSEHARLRAQALRGAGMTAYVQSEFSKARAWLEESVAIWRQST